MHALPARFQPRSGGDALCPACREESGDGDPAAQPQPRPPLSFWLHSPTAILIALNVLVFLAMAVSLRSASPRRTS